VPSKDKETALTFAAMSDDKKTVDTLLAAGAQRDPKNKTGWTPLIVAAINGHTEIVKSLLASGADMNARDEDNWTPLMQAAHNGHVETVKLLLKAGAGGADEAVKVSSDPAVLQILQAPPAQTTPASGSR
jgi:ankyrin repeat protein